MRIRSLITTRTPSADSAMTRAPQVGLLVLLSLLTHGCGGEGHRLSDQQWDQVVSMPQDNVRAAEQLVRRDAESRQQWLSLHQQLQSEREEIGRQRDLLEADRRLWQSRRRSDPIIAAAIRSCGLLLVCSLPLVLVALLLRPRGTDEQEASSAASDLLIQRLLSQHDDRARLASKKPDHDRPKRLS